MPQDLAEARSSPLHPHRWIWQSRGLARRLHVVRHRYTSSLARSGGEEVRAAASTPSAIIATTPPLPPI
uniref:Uncharacterized protein n=1 Tax=Oryza barthii TaxID=65489 RepID=A0A0D3HAL0_9ORYZ